MSCWVWSWMNPGGSRSSLRGGPFLGPERVITGTFINPVPAASGDREGRCVALRPLSSPSRRTGDLAAGAPPDWMAGTELLMPAARDPCEIPGRDPGPSVPWGMSETHLQATQKATVLLSLPLGSGHFNVYNANVALTSVTSLNIFWAWGSQKQI